jgi:MoxR-like ATPase
MEFTQLEKMTVSELRPLVREKGWNGASVLDASKTALIDFIVTGNKPALAQPATAPDMSQLGAMLGALVSSHLQAQPTALDETRVKELIAESLNGALKRIEVLLPTGKINAVGIQHNQFETLLKNAALRKHTMLTGPAGSGKTTVCEAVAMALEIPFYALSVGDQTTISNLLGYEDTTGTFRPGQFYHAYKNGGLILLDECDAGNANVLVCLNMLLANGACTFPNNERVTRHKDFVCFAACNTFGRGAGDYVGRNEIDAATLDRFLKIYFQYDEKLELAIGCNEQWTKQVQTWRKRALDLRLKVIISPRASITGGELLAAGYTQKETEDMTIFCGLSEDIINKIKG